MFLCHIPPPPFFNLPLFVPIIFYPLCPFFVCICFLNPFRPFFMFYFEPSPFSCFFLVSPIRHFLICLWGLNLCRLWNHHRFTSFNGDPILAIPSISIWLPGHLVSMCCQLAMIHNSLFDREYLIQGAEENRHSIT